MASEDDETPSPEGVFSFPGRSPGSLSLPATDALCHPTPPDSRPIPDPSLMFDAFGEGPPGIGNPARAAA
jgi:hypothetical protein